MKKNKNDDAIGKLKQMEATKKQRTMFILFLLLIMPAFACGQDNVIDYEPPKNAEFSAQELLYLSDSDVNTVEDARRLLAINVTRSLSSPDLVNNISSNSLNKDVPDNFVTTTHTPGKVDEQIVVIEGTTVGQTTTVDEHTVVVDGEVRVQRTTIKTFTRPVNRGDIDGLDNSFMTAHEDKILRMADKLGLTVTEHQETIYGR